jgi:hypothetical protein
MTMKRDTQVIYCSGRDDSGNNTNGLALKNVPRLLAVQAKGRKWWVGAELDRTLPAEKWWVGAALDRTLRAVVGRGQAQRRPTMFLKHFALAGRVRVGWGQDS